tara:strand:+ start:153 stop:374 length:222 start_codon:yes stop_codon:yes gene_type:complete
MGKKKKCKFKHNNGIKCKKKIKLTDYPCRCGNIFCSKHRMPETHNCTINYKEINRKSLLENLGGGQYSKIEVI